MAQHNAHHPEIDVLSETEATGIWYQSNSPNFRQIVSQTLAKCDQFERGLYKTKTN